MINKKLLLCFMMLFVFVATFVYADKISNFVSVLNGSNTKVEQDLSSSIFVGQSLVFETKDTMDLISTSGFASSISKVQSENIIFTNQTEQKTFSDIVVPVKVKIETNNGKNIVKVRYKISQGNGENWEDEIEYTKISSATVVNFSENITFSKGESENYIKIYAQYGDKSEYASSWSPAYTIKINGSVHDVIEFTEPDPLTKLSSLDPTIKTTEFSLNLSTVTVSLYKGNSDISGTELYKISLDTETNKVYKMYDEKLGKISYLNSDIIKIYNEQKSLNIPTTLDSNQEYTLKIESVNGSSTLTFKALGGGVADILTLPSPFNPKKEKVKIRYIIAKDANVTIKLYDKAGKIVCKLIQSESRNAGTNEELWDGRNYAGETLATGAYIVEIIAKSSSGEDRRYTALAIVGK